MDLFDEEKEKLKTLQYFLAVRTLKLFIYCIVFSFSIHGILLQEHNKTYLLTYYIATPPDRGWQRNEGLLLLHRFLSLDITTRFQMRKHFLISKRSER